MKTYQVEIKETLCMTIDIEAANRNDNRRRSFLAGGT